MKSALPILTCLLIALFILSPAVHAQSTGTAPNADIETAIFEKINAVRLAKGLPALEINADLAALARAHSRDMAEGREELGHDGFSKRFDIAREKIPGLKALGENVAYNFPQPDVAADTVKNWMASPVHRTNILRENTLTGVGVWRSQDGNFYFTQLFGHH